MQDTRKVPKMSSGKLETREEVDARAEKRRLMAAMMAEIPSPRAEATLKADEWVTHGVRALAKTCPAHEHIVLMAATHEHSGYVGVSSSVRADSLMALSALSRLVGEVNEAFIRDGVEVKLTLRMTELRDAVRGEGG